MPVYEGVLKRISGGTYLGSGESAAESFTRREFIEIGDKRLKSVVVQNYHDELLLGVIGQPVALSVTKNRGRYHVMAIRLPDGSVEKLDGRALFGLLVEGIFRVGLAAVVFGVGLFFSLLDEIVFWAVLAVALLFVVSYLRTQRQFSAARGALRETAVAPAASG